MDGDGWTTCASGHRHWGLHGAAGLLLVAGRDGGGRGDGAGRDGAGRDGGGRDGRTVLLQHRAPWSHHGDTWGIPGGARGARESAVAAALRETAEETGLPVERVALLAQVVDDHGGWSYTTVRGALPAAVPVEPLDGESTALAWVPLDEVHLRPLHPGFAAAWPGHLAALRAGTAAG